MNASWTELLFSNRADFTALASSATEASLLAGLALQPVFPPGFFLQFGKAVKIKASGVFSTTGTPTLIFQARLGTTQSLTYYSGTSIAVSAAVTTSSGITNARWDLDIDLVVNTPGMGSGNTTLSSSGKVVSPVGFAAPYIFDLEPTTPPTATWTCTVDAALAQYLQLSATWSASSSSNSITCKLLEILALN